MATIYTENFKLDKYTGDDKPNLRDQYNKAMDKIDQILTDMRQANIEKSNQINALNIKVQDLQRQIDELKGV